MKTFLLHPFTFLAAFIGGYLLVSQFFWQNFEGMDFETMELVNSSLYHGGNGILAIGAVSAIFLLRKKKYVISISIGLGACLTLLLIRLL